MVSYMLFLTCATEKDSDITLKKYSRTVGCESDGVKSMQCFLAGVLGEIWLFLSWLGFLFSEESSLSAEDDQVEEGVGSKPVSAMD
jgi:hypothetical protein